MMTIVERALTFIALFAASVTLSVATFTPGALFMCIAMFAIWSYCMGYIHGGRDS